MEISIARSCVYHDRIYGNGSAVRGYIYSRVCKDGEWADLDEESSGSKPSLAYMYH